MASTSLGRLRRSSPPAYRCVGCRVLKFGLPLRE
jgi:hypothetical protein